jgi:aminoglycoside 3-N-acetyltransferase
MSEQKVIAMVAQPGSRESIAADLRRLGVTPGMVLIVHSSLSAMGWVNGGPVSVIYALLDVLGSSGTLVTPTHSSDYSDPALWENPPVPRSWHESVRQTMPLFDPQRTPTRGIGRIPELFRTWSGVLRSAHPQLSFAAWGKEASFVTGDHSLAYSLGEGSPLARVYELGGYILLIGVGYDRNTSFHLAEYRVPNPPQRSSGTPWLENGRQIWKEFPDIDFQDDHFPAIGQDFEQQGGVKIGHIGAAESRLLPQRPAVDFAQEWLAKFRKQT